MEFADMMKEFTAAVEAGDGARLAALFTEDGSYHDTFYGEFQGREAIQAMLEDRFCGDAERFLWEMERPVSDGKTGYATWSFSYNSLQPESQGARVVFQGMSRFELEGGLIRRYTEKFDSGMALSQLGFAPERMAKLFHRWHAPLREQRSLRRHFEG